MADDMADGATEHDVQAPTPRRPTGPGMTIPRLVFAEQLVLWCSRRLAAAGNGPATTETEVQACRQALLDRVSAELGVALRATGGPSAGREAADALDRLLDIFSSAGTRGLRLNPLCCRFVSNDERLFLSFLAGCQAADCGHTGALLSWFLPPAAMRIAATEGAALAAALLGAGFPLPLRLRLSADAGVRWAAAANTAAPQTLH